MKLEDLIDLIGSGAEDVTISANDLVKVVADIKNLSHAYEAKRQKVDDPDEWGINPTTLIAAAAWRGKKVRAHLEDSAWCCTYGRVVLLSGDDEYTCSTCGHAVRLDGSKVSGDKRGEE